MNLREYNSLQIEESQSELNKYLFRQDNPNVEITKGRLLKYYIIHTSKIFAETHRLEVNNEEEEKETES